MSPALLNATDESARGSSGHRNEYFRFERAWHKRTTKSDEIAAAHRHDFETKRSIRRDVHISGVSENIVSTSQFLEQFRWLLRHHKLFWLKPDDVLYVEIVLDNDHYRQTEDDVRGSGLVIVSLATPLDDKIVDDFDRDLFWPTDVPEGRPIHYVHYSQQQQIEEWQQEYNSATKSSQTRMRAECSKPGPKWSMKLMPPRRGMQLHRIVTECRMTASCRTKFVPLVTKPRTVQRVEFGSLISLNRGYALYEESPEFLCALPPSPAFVLEKALYLGEWEFEVQVSVLEKVICIRCDPRKDTWGTDKNRAQRYDMPLSDVVAVHAECLESSPGVKTYALILRLANPPHLYRQGFAKNARYQQLLELFHFKDPNIKRVEGFFGPAQPDWGLGRCYAVRLVQDGLESMKRLWLHFRHAGVVISMDPKFETQRILLRQPLHREDHGKLMRDFISSDAAAWAEPLEGCWKLRYHMEVLLSHGWLALEHLQRARSTTRFGTLELPSTLMDLIVYAKEHYMINTVILAMQKFVQQCPLCRDPAAALWMLIAEEMAAAHAQGGKKQTASLVDDEMLMETYRVYVTPTRVLRHIPDVERSNRILRFYSRQGYSQHFLRVTFTDEWGSRPPTSKELIEKRFKPFLKSFVLAAGRRYFLLAASSSQLRSFGAWFFAPTHIGGRLLDADAVRRQMGNFKPNDPVAKWCARMGQCLSTTVAVTSLSADEVSEIPDIEKRTIDSVFGDGEERTHTFSDGIGRMSPALANYCKQQLGIPEEYPCPAAFQIRYKGYKGVLTVWQDLGDKRLIQLRPSMRKFEVGEQFNDLEVCSYSTFMAGYLNKHIILLVHDRLEGLVETPSSVFLDLQYEMLAMLNNMLDDHDHALKAMSLIGTQFETNVRHMITTMLERKMPLHEPFLQGCLKVLREELKNTLRDKFNIAVPMSASLIGVLDDYCLQDERVGLSETEVFFQIQKDGWPKPVPISGDVIVTKNPCLYPGDIRVLKAVPVKFKDGTPNPKVQHLKHLVNVLVFSQQGHRPETDKCSGSDLDGDIYFVSWDPRLIPTTHASAKDYQGAPQTGPRRPQIELEASVGAKPTGEGNKEDLAEWLAYFMMKENLGQIANAWVVAADQLSADERCGTYSNKCSMLVDLHSVAVDFPKNGKPAEFDDSLKPTAFPHFMEKPDREPYHSTGVLGKLYDRFMELTSEDKAGAVGTWAGSVITRTSVTYLSHLPPLSTDLTPQKRDKIERTRRLRQKNAKRIEDMFQRQETAARSRSEAFNFVSGIDQGFLPALIRKVDGAGWDELPAWLENATDGAAAIFRAYIKMWIYAKQKARDMQEDYNNQLLDLMQAFMNFSLESPKPDYSADAYTAAECALITGCIGKTGLVYKRNRKDAKAKVVELVLKLRNKFMRKFLEVVEDLGQNADALLKEQTQFDWMEFHHRAMIMSTAMYYTAYNSGYDPLRRRPVEQGGILLRSFGWIPYHYVFLATQDEQVTNGELQALAQSVFGTVDKAWAAHCGSVLPHGGMLDNMVH